MSHKLTDGGRVMHVGTLARVEGEGAMHIRAPRRRGPTCSRGSTSRRGFYEAFLRGRSHTEPPDITARICGICPVAYQMSSCWAIEDACGVDVPEEILLMRRLLYCGEWIESHALHIFLLHAPDFLGYDGAIEMAADHPDVVERGLRMKKAGNDPMDTVAGAPCTRSTSGWAGTACRRGSSCVRPRLERARDEALQTVALVAGFDFPNSSSRTSTVAHRRRLPDRVRQRGDLRWRLPGARVHPPHRGVPRRALQRAARPARRLARALCRRAAGEVLPQLRPALARGPGGRAVRRSGAHVPQPVPLDRRAGRGASSRPTPRHCASSTAGPMARRRAWPCPRGQGRASGRVRRPGVLFHRYVLDAAGIIQDAQIVPPTSQNQPSIEADLRTMVQSWSELDDHACSTGASRPSATTTRASPARHTSWT